ncbi:two-component system response regulator [Duganella sp. Leaf126]|uniref:response regulator n=1 Tax=Duganella sp. Leaf126 TaxID=1736266 RepID=UPI0006FD63C8|nr:response regulator [Duganella sp. Leaf126]KQQ36305.1 two-component system response regulator [Duganella sp. Leaf126]
MSTLFTGTAPPLPATRGLILIVEDEPEIVEIVRAYLARDGFRTATAANGHEGLRQHLAHNPDLVILDVAMPELDGWEVLTELRRRGDTPVIMLTAHDQDIDKLTGLRIGADDYVVKPFNPSEVVARVRAVLRRTQANRASADKARILECGPLRIDLDLHQAHAVIDGVALALPLTLTEFRLAAYLARTPQRVVARSELLTACLPEGDTLERTVDSHISKLRRKLEDARIVGMPFSIRGVGYRMAAE